MSVGVGKPLRKRSPLLAATSKAAAMLAVYEGANTFWSQAGRYYRDSIVHSIIVDESDHLYPDVQEWILEALPESSQKSLIASTVTLREARAFYEDGDPGASQVDPGKTKVKLSLNDKHPQKLQVNGHKVQVQVLPVSEAIASKSATGAGQPNVVTSSNYRTPMCVQFTARTKSGQQAVIELLETLQKEKKGRSPVLRLTNQWGGWSTRSDLPLRDLDSVILPDQQKNRIVEDLKEFLEAEDRYLELALPWHRGVMLHGKPGVGKSSLVKAIANEFGLDLWCLSLSDLEKDASLTGLIGEVRPRSILLLEDIDTVKITNDRSSGPSDSDAGPSISLSSLLNALDGVATPHGLITFMTTNHFDKLDPALTRAGRMDRVERLDYPTPYDVRRMYKRFYGNDGFVHQLHLGGPSQEERQVPFSQAEASEVFKRHLRDARGAATAIERLCLSKTTVDADL